MKLNASCPGYRVREIPTKPLTSGELGAAVEAMCELLKLAEVQPSGRAAVELEPGKRRLYQQARIRLMHHQIIAEWRLERDATGLLTDRNRAHLAAAAARTGSAEDVLLRTLIECYLPNLVDSLSTPA